MWLCKNRVRCLLFSASSGGGGGLSTAGIVAIVVAGAIGIALVGWYFARRRTAEERE